MRRKGAGALGDVMSNGRRTRSGTEYSPWVADGAYGLDVNFGDIMAQAWEDRSKTVDSAQLDPVGGVQLEREVGGVNPNNGGNGGNQSSRVEQYDGLEDSAQLDPVGGVNSNDGGNGGEVAGASSLGGAGPVSAGRAAVAQLDPVGGVNSNDGGNGGAGGEVAGASSLGGAGPVSAGRAAVAACTPSSAGREPTGAHGLSRARGVIVEREPGPTLDALAAESSSPPVVGAPIAVCVSSNIRKKSKAERKKERTKQHKTAKRAENRQKRQAIAGTRAKAVSLKRIDESRKFGTDVDASHLRRTQRGYVGTAERPPVHSSRSLDELVSNGFLYIPWDGTSSISLFDAGRRMIVGGGSPRTADWAGVSNRCANALDNARIQCGDFYPKQTSHRRGKFPALAVGISYGQGQRRPGLLCNLPQHVDALNELFDNEDFRRVAGFQGALFRSFAPDLAEEYNIVLNRLESSQPELRRNFPNSDFASTTVNLGPQTVSITHADSANLAYGLCAITALGDFDPDQGGQLILWNLRVVIRFPPGSTLLVPSALIPHSNLPIQPEESRYSVTQYSAGSLFRWVDNGLCSDGDRLKTTDQIPTEWLHGLDKFRTLPRV
ncbi:hypothetical protein EYR40_002197 [Pleurotus pulmonarius]|nr:hypothetical protein EYR36_002311 [Pleurotus pulmonarius]KAF4583706.1 hypothetical protein EYR40_002197 [Pleurotus pulmonarius]